MTKKLKTLGEEIAEQELNRLHDKAFNSSEGLSLEDVKKLDILLKNLREDRDENVRKLREEYEKLQKRLVDGLPSEELVKLIDESLEEKDVTEEESEEE